MKKRIIALLLSCCMALTLFGCSNLEEDAPADDPAETEIIKITTAGSEKASVIYPDGDSLTDNIWIRDFKEKLNIELTYDWISDEYTTKLNLSIISQKLPDVFAVTESQLKQLVEAGMVWDLTEVFDQYASDSLKDLRSRNEEVFQTAIFDNGLYGIPELHTGDISQVNYVWIRNDWKEELGLADPQTMDDVINISEAFKEHYSDYALCSDRKLAELLDLAPAWQAYPGMWVTGKAGSIEYGSVQPEMKNALAAWAEWYKKGILNEDFAVVDSNKVTERAVSGELGIMIWPSWWGYSPGPNVVKNLGNDAIFYPYAIPSATDEEVLDPINFANTKYTVVNKNCKHPEAAIEILNYYQYMLTDAYADGVPYEEIVTHTENNMMHAVPFRILDTNKEVEQFNAVSNAVTTKDTSVLTASFHWEVYNATMDWLELHEADAGLGGYLQQGACEKAAYGVASKRMEAGKFLKSKLWGASPEILANYGSTLDDLLREGFTKIIVGEESIDYFDTLVKQWKEAGGEAVTKAVNDMYGNK